MWEDLAVGAVLFGAAFYWVKKVIPSFICRRVARPAGMSDAQGMCSGCSGCGSDSGGCH